MEVLETFISRLQEQIELHADNLSRGNAEDFANYAGQCGLIKGLRMSLNTLQTLIDEMRSKDID